jgi:hypothetical protein
MPLTLAVVNRTTPKGGVIGDGQVRRHDHAECAGSMPIFWIIGQSRGMVMT